MSKSSITIITGLLSASPAADWNALVGSNLENWNFVLEFDCFLQLSVAGNSSELLADTPHAPTLSLPPRRRTRHHLLLRLLPSHLQLQNLTGLLRPAC